MFSRFPRNAAEAALFNAGPCCRATHARSSNVSLEDNVSVKWKKETGAPGQVVQRGTPTFTLQKLQRRKESPR
jgi:hypothetical protein